MKASINGCLRELPDGLTVGALLDLLGSVRKGIAVACNERVVRRAEFETQRLAEGDRVEIIEAVAGG